MVVMYVLGCWTFKNTCMNIEIPNADRMRAHILRLGEVLIFQVEVCVFVC